LAKKRRVVRNVKKTNIIPDSFKFDQIKADPIEELKSVSVRDKLLSRPRKVKSDIVNKMMQNSGKANDHCSNDRFCVQAKYCVVALVILFAGLAIYGMYDLTGESVSIEYNLPHAFCMNDMDCEYGCILSSGTECKAELGNCECAGKPLGDFCASTRECQNAYCSSSKICGGLNARCEGDEQCFKGGCSVTGYCKLLKGYGESCRDDDDCKSGRCGISVDNIKVCY